MRNSGPDPLKVVLLLLAAWAGFWWLKHGPVRPTDGESAPAVPLQAAVQDTRPWVHKRVLIKPLARYTITARVLHRKTYRFDKAAAISPLDFALGWGPMSDPANYQKLSISQEGRWYHYSYATLPPGLSRGIAPFSANTHLIPANDDVRKTLLAVRQNETVRLKGYLVCATDKGGNDWQSSLTRDDTGNGSCEVMWVDEAERLK